MARVLVPLAEGFEEIEALTVVDVLRRGGVDVVTAALGATVDVPGAHGIMVKADAPFDRMMSQPFDAVVLPGGADGTARLAESEALTALLRRVKEANGLLCAICAAPTVLEAAGVADADTHMTCYPTMRMQLDRAWADAPVVEDGDLITGQAPGSAMLFALVILQRLAGHTVAARVARGLVTDVLDVT